ncbi:MAG: diguanylate cyclase [Polynucleobacter sp.]
MKVDEKGNSRISTRALFRGTLLIGLGTLALIIVAISWFDHQAREIRVAGRESTAKMMAEGVAIAIQDDVISENYAQIEGRLRQTLSDPQVLSILVADEDGKVLSHLQVDSATRNIKPIYSSPRLQIPTQSSEVLTVGDATTQWLQLVAGVPIGWLRLEIVGTKVDDALTNLRRQVAIWLLSACFVLLLSLSMVLWRTRGLIKIEEAVIQGRTDALQKVAYHDSLTELPNRYLLLDRLGQAIASSNRNQTSFALCFIDLDGFKLVNDDHGHDAGDFVLREVARRLTACVRENDTVARLGGDEFVVILVDVDISTGFHTTLDRILAAIKKPIAIPEGVEIAISLSMGVTVFPDDLSSPDDLLNHADEAMYLAKNTGPGQYSFYQS